MSLKEGWLTKQGGFIRTWKRRWFVLTKKELIYFSNPGQSEKGRIAVANSTCALAPECKTQPAFKVQTPKRTYFIVGESFMDVDLWLQAIRYVQSGEAEREAEAKQNTALELQKKTQLKKYQIEDFEILKLLGKGRYGKVHLVKCKENGKIYAMKAISKKTLAESDQISQILTEKDILMKNSHPFLVSAHFTFQNEAKIFMVIDFIPGGELFKRLAIDHSFSEERSKLYAAELLLGLSHIHRLGFIYRDLKPENILVDKEGHIKITDFGLAKKTQGATTTFCGTPEYLAPEMLLGQPYTKVVDWWSYGTIVYEMMAGIPPFFNDNIQVMYKMILNDAPSFPEQMSKNACDFIGKLLSKNPEERLGYKNDAEEIKAHPFFKSINWESVYNLNTHPHWKPTITSETDVQNFDPKFTESVTQSVPDGTINEDTQNMFKNFTCTKEPSFTEGA